MFFPSMVAELFHPVLCPGTAHLTFQQFFLKENLNYWNLVGDRFSLFFFFFNGILGWTGVLCLTQQEAGIGTEITNKRCASEFHISF